ncbi:aminopeptidase N [Aestuariivirga litoralis]|uniref:aminopeptidase N n=1 Tax=Aestuariivirga litoralis TaxID=2650924 RepID=UPI0018C78BD5|nr:aminopeptidase N [Aestuariivirga litoralis]MBG1232203.1 aminopeptidase N [Aestuariivirga litoralis]
MRTETPKTIFLKDYKPTPYLVDSVKLTFRLHDTETLVRAEMRMKPNKASKTKSAALELDGEMIKLLSVAINGELLSTGDYDLNERKLVIRKPPAKAFTLAIETQCDPAGNTALSGLYMSNGMFCTQCEAEGFRRITYFYDRPDVLAKYHVRIEAPKRLPVLLSNGNPAASGEIAGTDRHFAEWDDPHPKPSYLFALVAGDLASVHDRFTTSEGREVGLGIYVEKGKESRCAWAMQSLKASMRWDEKVFKRAYDLDVFNIVAVSDFNMGAMENKGLNIFNDKYVLALPETATDTDFQLIEAIIAHEYFHNWTGNRITCRDWFQLCLKEGLTVFRDQEFTADMRSRDVKRIDDVQDVRARQFPEDFGPLQHPPRPSSYIEINNFYTSTVYEKGAEVCRMILTLIGAKAFDKGMQLYFKRHDGEAATVEQFVACFEAASGRKLKQFFRWYEQAGTPQVAASGVYNAKAKTYTLTLTQSVKRLKGQKPKQPLHMPLALGLIGPDGKALYNGMVELTKAVQVFTFKNIAAKPVLSLNRNFSAPVVLKRRASEKDLLLQLAHDSDSFNRWEAGQELAQKLMLERYHGKEANKWPQKVEALAEALRQPLADPHLDDAYKAKLLEFPGFEQLLPALVKDVDPARLNAAHTDFISTLAQSLESSLREIYQSTESTAAYLPDDAQSGQRALRYQALGLASQAKAPWVDASLIKESISATNMTAEYGALRIATRFENPLAEDLLARFYQSHSADPLLIDKWFAAQATTPGENSAARVRALMSHKDFTVKTPNRVYALLRNFIGANFNGFHAPSGEGYRLAADVIIAIDAINPQVASRLATGFRTWRMFDVNNRQKAQGELQRILAAKPLSPDVFEIISRTLKA